MKPLIIPSLCLLLVGLLHSSQGQAKYEWKEMATVGVYDYKTPTFWNHYRQDRPKIEKNIIRARKLGFNMVRFFLNYVPVDYRGIDDPNPPPYDHGWSSPVGTGKAFQTVASRKYLEDISTLVNFCKRNSLKVHILLFNWGGRNEASLHGKTSPWPYHNNYAELGGSQTVLDQGEKNLWFVDATAWLDHILTHLDLEKVEVFELFNEVAPTGEIQDSPNSYPNYFPNIALLELTNYVNHRWPRVASKLMISVGQGNYLDNYKNLQALLKERRYVRPAWMTYADSFVDRGLMSSTTLRAGNLIDKFYFRYFSIHNYNTYSFGRMIHDIIGLGEMQPGGHPYDWFIGEAGYDLKTNGSYEADQAKFYLSALKMIDETYEELHLQPGPKLKGVGIWSVFDIRTALEPGSHVGILSPDSTTVRKRKAAYVVENVFEGLVNNPNFDLGRGDDREFDDSPYCNGWAAWYDGRDPPRGNANLFKYNPSGFVSLMGSSLTANTRLGWRAIPAQKIRVLPGTRLKLSCSIRLDGKGGSTSKAFVTLGWLDQKGNLMRYAEGKNPANPAVTKRWQSVSIDDTVPEGAAYAVPYLMGWNLRTIVDFDSVQYTPEARPLITFTFDGDIAYYPADEKKDPLGWWIEKGTVSRNGSILALSDSTTINSTGYIDAVYVTGIWILPNAQYSVVAEMRSSSANLNAFTLRMGEADYPLFHVGAESRTEAVQGNLWSSIKTNWINGSTTSRWLNIRLRGGGGMTEVKSITVFERRTL